MNIKQVLINKSKGQNELFYFEYYPILRYTDLPFHYNFILSYIISWNKLDRVCFSNNETIAKYCSTEPEVVGDTIDELIKLNIIFKKPKKTKYGYKTGYKVSSSVLLKLIDSKINDIKMDFTKDDVEYLETLFKSLNTEDLSELDKQISVF